jgi:uncharacterized membrane protein SirB2
LQISALVSVQFLQLLVLHCAGISQKTKVSESNGGKIFAVLPHTFDAILTLSGSVIAWKIKAITNENENTYFHWRVPTM